MPIATKLVASLRRGPRAAPRIAMLPSKPRAAAPTPAASGGGERTRARADAAHQADAGAGAAVSVRDRAVVSVPARHPERRLCRCRGGAPAQSGRRCDIAGGAARRPGERVRTERRTRPARLAGTADAPLRPPAGAGPRQCQCRHPDGGAARRRRRGRDLRPAVSRRRDLFSVARQAGKIVAGRSPDHRAAAARPRGREIRLLLVYPEAARRAPADPRRRRRRAGDAFDRALGAAFQTWSTRWCRTRRSPRSTRSPPASLC